MTYLHQNTTASFLPHDIYNIRAASKRVQLRGLNATDALFKDLKAWSILYNIEVNPNSRVQYFFFAFPKSLKLAMENQDVILADCTYNTTKYGLPLLHLVGKYAFSYGN